MTESKQDSPHPSQGRTGEGASSVIPHLQRQAQTQVPAPPQSDSPDNAGQETADGDQDPTGAA